ncbi:glycoside hydrolase family 31 protein [Rathayibacter sp. Leaf248]|uniref:glycoside hydrolase family 31 protein n=1 Tax=Rathayibacter sp. Leaf248 TaxID=2876555 RepID=UPI001E5F21D0|nr:TIM-barrel domain-containing protein [Rathayibacter sp. Leaf248]
MSNFRLTDTSIEWRGAGETVRVEAWGPDSIRVRSRIGGPILDADFALLPPSPSTVRIEAQGDVVELRNGEIVVTLEETAYHDAQAGYATTRCDIVFSDADGRRLLSEHRHGGALKIRAREFRAHLGGAHRITASFESDPDEKLFGMGLYQQTDLDLKGSTFELAHRNSQTSIPFVLSSAGYGFLWHNPAIGRATLGRNRSEWVAEASEQLDYWVTAGRTPGAITRAYADATGHAPMMPEYGLGYWQCKLRYTDQEQLLAVAREHRRRGLPLDVIVADFFHWPKMGDFRFEDEFWPDPAAMTAELKELGVELMVSVWPQISVESENFERLRADNLLVRTERGPQTQMSFEGPSLFIDTTNPAARDALWELCRRNYHEKGARLFWLDEAEPEYGVYDFDNYRYHAGTNLQVGNIYPQTFSRTFHDGMTASGQDDVVNLVRSAWAGSQRYGALVWSGDIASSWVDFRRQVVAGIHMGVAGIPWFTTDIGGFHGGDGRDEAFRELLVRWFQFGTFSPVMRMHGDRRPAVAVTAADGSRRADSGADNELWSFGDDVYEILAEHVHLRESLRPYTRRIMREAHEAGQPVIRGLFHEFPEDPRAWEIADQYLFGPDLLIAPVLEPGQRGRRVYLPRGADWVDQRTGERFSGGRTIDVTAPIGSIPVLVRDISFAELIARPS